MQFITVRELSRGVSKYIKLANEEEDVIITRNGRPYAVLQKINGDDLEDFILAKHFNLNNEFRIAQKEHEESRTVNARELLARLDEN